MYLNQNNTLGGMGDVYNCEVMSYELKQRLGNEKIVAKILTAGSNALFLQEVAIMTLFIGNENFVKNLIRKLFMLCRLNYLLMKKLIKLFSWFFIQWVHWILTCENNHVAL